MALVILIHIIPLASYSQTLSVKAFETASMDLTARIKPVKDANGNGCALLKIVSPDVITRVEGNVLKEVDDSNEYWVYLSVGSKSVKLFTRHHNPLSLDISRFINSGVMSQCTYLLELESDLPVELLYGVENPLSHFQMAAGGSESRPVWWNMDEPGLFVGISCPTFDGESAKLAAISNALNLYAQSTGASVWYCADISCRNDSTDYQQSYMLSLKGFDLRILQEYYSPTGEYYVLCKISRVENGDNEYGNSWTFADNEDEGRVTSETRFKVKISRSSVDCHMDYECVWNREHISFHAFVNGNEILNRKFDATAAYDDLAGMKLRGGTGLNQLRLVSALPCLPDSVSIAEMEEVIDSGDFRATYVIRGSGISTPRDYKILNCDDDGCTAFDIPEKFPAAYLSEPLLPGDELDKRDLSVKYYRNYGCFAVGNTDKAISLEHDKNVAFLNGFSPLCHIIQEQMSAQLNRVELMNGASMSSRSAFELGLPIYPLWYLDSTERRKYKNRKNRSYWEHSLSEVAVQAGIVSSAIR